MSELQNRIEGKIYDPNVIELVDLRQKAHALCAAYNVTPEEDEEKRESILKELMPDAKEGLFFQGPIQLDYGWNIHVGRCVYANFNFTVLDTCPVTIGDNVYFGPNCSLYTPMHPFLPNERNLYMHENGYLTDREYGKPIVIGSNCWFGGNVTVIGGVHVGEGCVIGAGSVVTRDLPPNHLCAGNPCRPIRPITEADSIYLKKNLF